MLRVISYGPFQRVLHERDKFVAKKRKDIRLCVRTSDVIVILLFAFFMDKAQIVLMKILRGEKGWNLLL